jgi:hypothetical protein
MRLISLSATGAGTQTEEYLMRNTFTKIVTILALALCVSSAKAGIIWTSAGGSQSGGVSSGSVSGTVTFAVNKGDNLNGNQITLTLTAANGYSISGISSSFGMTGIANLDSITIGGTTSTSGFIGSSTQTFTPPTAASTVNTTFSGTLQGGNTLTVVYTLSGGAGQGPGNNSTTLTLNNFSFSGTVVPEPTNYALAGFGLLVVGGTAGRFAWRRRQQA